MAQLEAQVQEQAAEAASEGFDAGQVIIEHVANSSLDHPLLHLPTIAGIDFSVTKHVFMLWVVAGLLFLIVTATVRRDLRQDRMVPSGFMNALESLVEYIRDFVAEPSIGHKWTKVWTPLLLTLFVFILGSNAIGMIPIFRIGFLKCRLGQPSTHRSTRPSRCGCSSRASCGRPGSIPARRQNRFSVILLAPAVSTLRAAATST